MIRSYSDLINLVSFNERFDYLKLDGVLYEETFGFDRYINQAMYGSSEWKKVRDLVIVRDRGCDLGIEPIVGSVVIHHMNPISVSELRSASSSIFDPEFLITTSPFTHRAIHYGNISRPIKLIERKPGDTKLW